MKILFLGNSHTYYNDMPLLFQEICAERGKSVQVRMLAQSGVTYGWHLRHEIELRFELMHGEYDYLIMQQAAHRPAPSKEETHRDGHVIAELARRFGTVPIQTVPWAEKKDPAHQAEMYEIFEEFAEKEKLKLNPIGRIFEDIFYHYPEIDMYWIDGEHASPYGTYALALCIYATIFREKVSAVSLSHSYHTYPVPQKDWEKVEAAREAAKRNPDRPELAKEAASVWGQYCRALLDKEKAFYPLDPAKAEVIRSLVDRYAGPC